VCERESLTSFLCLFRICSDGDTIRFLHTPTRFHPIDLRKEQEEKASATALPIRICTIDTPETAKFGKSGQVRPHVVRSLWWFMLVLACVSHDITVFGQTHNSPLEKKPRKVSSTCCKTNPSRCACCRRINMVVPWVKSLSTKTRAGFVGSSSHSSSSPTTSP
jgi:hypothetical protein